MVSPVLQCYTQCNIITLGTGPTGRWNFKSLKYFSAFDEISHWTAEIQRSPTKIFGSYWVTSLWLMPHRFGLQLIRIYSHRIYIFFCHGVTMSNGRLSLFWVCNYNRQCLYKRLNGFIHDERNLDYGFQFKHGEVFLSKISKVSYIFTDPGKILYVAELIELKKK